MMSRDDRKPSDSFQEIPADEDQASAEEPSDGPVAQLLVELGAAKEESEQWRDRFLRKAAELENYRKRTDKERVDVVLQAKSSVLVEILPIMDACERAMESFGDVEDAHQTLEQYREGVELLYKQLGNTMNRLGVVPIEAEGEKFDPHLHEAVSREVTPDFEENTVTRELRRGYLFQERLLRPVQVVVAVRPQGEQEREE